MILLGLEIIMTLILLIMPGDPSVIVVCIIAILAFACFMYALRGVLLDAIEAENDAMQKKISTQKQGGPVDDENI